MILQHLANCALGMDFIFWFGRVGYTFAVRIISGCCMGNAAYDEFRQKRRHWPRRLALYW